MATIPKKWLQRKIADLESCREDIPFGLDENDHNMLIALKIALSSLEAEAVMFCISGQKCRFRRTCINQQSGC